MKNHFMSAMMAALVILLVPTGLLAQDAKASDTTGAKKDTVEFLTNQLSKVRTMIHDARSKGDGVWLTTSVTLTNVKDCCTYWQQKADELLKDQKPGKSNEIALGFLKAEAAAYQKFLDAWLKSAPSRFGVGRFETAKKEMEEAFQWHQVSFSNKDEWSGAIEVLGRISSLKSIWSAYRDFYKPGAKSTAEVLDQPGLSGWSLVSSNCTDTPAYRDGMLLYLAMREQVGTCDLFFKDAKDELKKALDGAGLSELRTHVTEFEKLFKAEQE